MCVSLYQMKSGKTDQVRVVALLVPQRNTFLHRWCDETQSYWKARTSEDF